MAEAGTLVIPTAVWCEVAVKDVGKEEVILENDQKLTSRLLAETAGTAEKLCLFTVTIGSYLRRYNCDIVQGFLLGRPVSEETAVALLDKCS